MAKCPGCEVENPVSASFCMSCGTNLGVLGGRRDARKAVTVVFCDVTGSTALGEALDPETLRRVMMRYFDSMRTALEHHGGTVEKFIGDAVMAVFGIPHVHEDDALRAVRAAAEMRSAVHTLSAELAGEYDIEFSARIGVNTGDVIAGDPSTAQTLVTGDAVNVAARLEQAADPGQILIGASTFRLVRDYVEADPVGPLSLKGKSSTVAAFRLVTVSDIPDERRRHPGSPMVGRRRELAALRTAFDRAVSDRACQSFTILAPAGTGKSRLVEEFLASVRGTRALTGRCLPYGEGITYFPVVQIVKQAAGLADFDAPDVVEAKVRALLGGDEYQDLVCGRVTQVLGVGSSGSPDDTVWAVRRLIEAVATTIPLVLVLDDLQWAEPTLLDLLEHVAEWSREVPLLLICMARPELLDIRPSWGGGRLNSSTISLEPLSDAECGELVVGLLGAGAVPDGVRTRVTSAAGGTPLFVEEMLAMLVDDGLLTRTSVGWEPVTDLSDVGIPPTISAVLAARLDRLSSDERRVLDAASVIGHEFLAGAVRELVPEAMRSTATTQLMSLVRKEFLRTDRSTLPGEDAFRFRHLLIRDAAYEALPKELRAQLHELVASWLEKVAGDRITEQEEVVGYHLEQAHRYRTDLNPHDLAAPELARRASRALAASGGRALDRGDMRAVAGLLSRAVALLPVAEPERLRLLPDLADALSEVGHDDQATTLLSEGVALAEQLGEPGLRAHLALAFAGFDQEGTVEESNARAQSEAHAAIRVLEQADDQSGLAKARRALGFVEWNRGQVERSIAQWEQSAVHAEAAGDQIGATHDRAWQLIAHLFGRMPCEELRARAREAIAVVDTLPAAKPELLWTLAACQAMLGNFEEARLAHEESTRIERMLGRHRTDSAFGPQIEELILRMQGQHRQRVDGLRKGVDDYNRLTHEQHPLLLSLLAGALVDLGENDQARSAAVHARTVGGDYLHVAATLLPVEAVLLARNGEDDLAVARAEEALDLVKTTEFFWVVADTQMAVGEVHRLAGRSANAARAFQDALERYEHKQMLTLANQARVAIRSVHLE